LKAHIRLVRPRVVVLMGDKANKAVFPDAGKISEEHGIEKAHPDFPGVVFFPVFHPSYLMRLMPRPTGHSDVVKSLNEWQVIKRLYEGE